MQRPGQVVVERHVSARWARVLLERAELRVQLRRLRAQRRHLRALHHRLLAVRREVPVRSARARERGAAVGARVGGRA